MLHSRMNRSNVVALVSLLRLTLASMAHKVYSATMASKKIRNKRIDIRIAHALAAVLVALGFFQAAVSSLAAFHEYKDIELRLSEDDFMRARGPG